MRTTLSIIAACLLAATACTETYPGQDLDMSGNGVLEEWGIEDSIAVQDEYKLISVAISDPSYTTITSTRGLGAFDYERADSLRRLMSYDAHFYLYAFQDTTGVNFTTTSYRDSTVCLLDGVSARAIDPTSYMLSYDGDQKYFWPVAMPRRRYNFWGYYTDTDSVTISREADKISLSFEIDGSQDILSGKAELTDKQTASINASDKRESFLGSLYSYYTTRHDIFPVINLRHRLARLKFQVFPGDAYADGIIIDSLCVFSPYKCTMTIVSQDDNQLGCVFDEDRKWLSLHDVNNEATLAEGHYMTTWKEEYDSLQISVFHRDTLMVGESMMVPPTDTLRIMICAHKFDKRGKRIEVFPRGNVTFATYPKGGFRAGHQYDIRLALYEPQKIEASAILKGWAAGEEIVINPSDDAFVSGAGDGIHEQ